MGKRSMNRVPGPNDTWWAKHTRECGGVYTKISEPKAFTKKQKKKKEREQRRKEREERKANGLDVKKPAKTKKRKRKKEIGIDNGRTLLDMFSVKAIDEPKKKKQKMMQVDDEEKKCVDSGSDLEILMTETKKEKIVRVNCPICGKMIV